MPTMYEIRRAVATRAAARTTSLPSAAAASPATPISRGAIGTRRSTAGSTSPSSLSATGSSSDSSSVDFDDETVPPTKSSGYRKSLQKKQAGSKRKASRQGRSSGNRRKASPQAVTTDSIPIGNVGYKFRRSFEGYGVFTGEVIKIRPGAKDGKDRRCRYEDGDEEDLSMDDLIDLENERIVRENSKVTRVAPPKKAPASRPCSQSPGSAKEVGQAMEESAESGIPVVDAELVLSPDDESSVPDDAVAPVPAPPVPSIPLSAGEKEVIESRRRQIKAYDFETLELNSKGQLDFAEQMCKGTVNFYTDFRNVSCLMTIVCISVCAY